MNNGLSADVVVELPAVVSRRSISECSRRRDYQTLPSSWKDADRSEQWVDGEDVG